VAAAIVPEVRPARTEGTWDERNSAGLLSSVNLVEVAIRPMDRRDHRPFRKGLWILNVHPEGAFCARSPTAHLTRNLRKEHRDG
jgi:hypothetical protein